MNIFLLGYMGCGKTILGKSLAKSLDADFIDLDQYIEQKMGQSIVSVFSNEGEDVFREKECEHLKEIAVNSNNTIIATGGGTPCFHQNMEVMKSHGNTIYLDCPIEILEKRLSQESGNRPLLKWQRPDQLNQFIQQHLEYRLDFYTKAHHTVQVGENEKENLEKIIALLQ